VREGERGMPDTTDRAEAEMLADDAIDWLVLLHSGRATDADRTAFAQWQEFSPAHAAAAREAGELWDEIGQTETALRFAPEPASARRTAVSRRALLGGVLTASVGGLVVLSGAVGPTAGLLAQYRTRRGERRHVTLPDGSIAWLNTQTALSVAFSAQERRLVLHAGEALFDVRKDPSRPFIVEAGAGQARAVGTVYAVRHSRSEVQVDVVEGRVEVTPRAGMASRLLTANQRAGYGPDGFLGGLQTVDAAAVTAWQRGKLIFNRQPLGSVVEALSAYRYGRILIADAALKAMPVTGVFDLADDKATFELLEATLPIEVLRLPLLTVLRARR
jgi:transmembrane sensor